MEVTHEVETIDSAILKNDESVLTLYYNLGLYYLQIKDQTQSIKSFEAGKLSILERDIKSPIVTVKYHGWLIKWKYKGDTPPQKYVVSEELIVPLGKLVIKSLP